MFIKRKLNTQAIKRKTHPTTCKYCRKDVFYHQNDRGSKVFFNELGKPWDLHRCAEYLSLHMWH